MQIFTRNKSNFKTETQKNFNKFFKVFISVVQKVIDKHALVKQMSRKLRKLKSKPWITKGIYSSICTKNRMYKSDYILGDKTRKHEYKVYANKLTKIKTLAKKNYYAEELDKNKSYPRKTWELLRMLLPGKSSKHAKLSQNISLNGSKITDQQTILEKFNKFFSIIGEN